MCVSSSLLILSLSLFSQGFLLSVSNSLQKVEDADRLLTTLNLGNALRSEDRAVNGAALPLLKRYEAEDSSILDEENDINMKLLATGSRNGFLHPAMPFSLGRKQLRYLALQGALAFPGDTAVRDIESMQERETAGRENEAKFPVGRRDFDVLRCMLGRVYRPCWQA